jgi:predicted  nucleic acid-binding Zn-ribbon protein
MTKSYLQIQKRIALHKARIMSLENKIKRCTTPNSIRVYQDQIDKLKSELVIK